MKRVFIITQDEPFYIPKMLRYLIENSKDDFKIVGYTILKPHRKNKNILHWILERTRIYSLVELVIVVWAIIIVKIFNLFGNRFSGRQIFQQSSIKEITTSDINAKYYLESLLQLDIDIIISISCPQLFGVKLLEIAKLGCINAHGTLLPRHRGVFGSWWTLYCGDNEAGATIHSMELRLDAGEIMWQKEFSVKNDDTQYSIAYKTKRIMAYGLADTIRNYEDKNKHPLREKYQSSYHKAPTKELGSRFHKNGLRVIKLNDLKKIFSEKY